MMTKDQARFAVPIPEPVDGPPSLPPQYVNHSGKPVAKDDPDRLLWYGPCFFWTDNWDLVSPTRQGIPRCPVCGAPGFQMVYADWMEQAERYERDGHPGYVEWMNSVKEQCRPESYELSRISQEAQDIATQIGKIKSEAPE